MQLRRLAELRLVDDPWVSVDQVTAHLGVSQDSVYRWIASRGLPAHRIGRLWKFKLSDVDAWVRTGAAAPLARGLDENGPDQER